MYFQFKSHFVLASASLHVCLLRQPWRPSSITLTSGYVGFLEFQDVDKYLQMYHFNACHKMPHLTQLISADMEIQKKSEETADGVSRL